MPERQITDKELEGVMDWVYDTKDGDHRADIYPGTENGVWIVDSEPLVIYSRERRGTPGSGVVRTGIIEHYLLCSDKQAKGLEAIGTIQFTEKTDVAETSA